MHIETLDVNSGRLVVAGSQCKDPEPVNSRLVIIVDEIEHYSPVSLHFATKEDVYYFNRPFRHTDW